jgi:hypothetical protein
MCPGRPPSLLCTPHSLFPLSQLLSWALQLTNACLGYDFIGTYSDDSADDLRAVQIPACAFHEARSRPPGLHPRLPLAPF